MRLRVRTAWSERLRGCERCSLSSTIAEDVCITMPPPIFRGAVPGDVMHLLDPHATIGERCGTSMPTTMYSSSDLIAQFVRSVESSEGCRAVRYVCQTPAPIGYYYEPGQSGW